MALIQADKPKRPLMVPGLMAGLSLMILFGTLYLLAQKTNYLAAEVIKRQNYRQDLNLLDQALTDYENSRPQILRVGASLPGSYQEVAHALVLIEAIAETNQQQLTIKADEMAVLDAGKVESLRLTMTTAGSYRGLSGFLADIASLPYHTRIDSIKLDAGSPPTALIIMKLYLSGESNEL